MIIDIIDKHKEIYPDWDSWVDETDWDMVATKIDQYYKKKYSLN